jgi:hypothetical protein
LSTANDRAPIDGTRDVGPGEQQATGVQYYPVSPLKLVLLSVFTWSIYDIYWFYRQWKYVKRRDDSKIMPFWRALFGILWFFPLLGEVDRANGRDRMASNGLLALAYLSLATAWRLPDPYWLLSLASTLCLLVLNRRIWDLPGQPREEIRKHGRLTVANVLVVLLMSPLIVISVGSSLHLMPATQVVEGGRLWSWQTDFLRDEGLLDEGETVEYFYSEAFLSIREAGNLVTDQSLVAYFRDPGTGELLGGYAFYEDILAIHAAYSDDPLDHSVIAVTDVDGATFELLASKEGGGDKIFVAGIRRHFPGVTTGSLAAYRAAEPLPEATAPAPEATEAGAAAAE